MKIISTFLIILIFSTNLIFAQNYSGVKKVGIIPFKNLSNKQDHAWISDGIEYLLANKISFLSTALVYDDALLKKALTEEGYSYSTFNDRIIYHIGKKTGINIIIMGTYKVSGKNINVHTLYKNAFDGSDLLVLDYSKPLSQLFEISSDMTINLIELINNNSGSGDNDLHDYQITSSIKAFEYFIKGYIENSKQSNRLNEVEKMFKKAISEDPGFLEAQYNLGITYFNKKSYTEALQQFNNVIQEIPKFNKPYFGRGLIYEEQKNHNLAITDFRKVIELNPNDYKSYFHLGRIYISKNEYNEAEKYLNKAKDLNPDNAPVYYELGNLFFNRALYRDAVTEYKKAIGLDNENAGYHLALGKAYYYAQTFYLAYDEFNKAAKLDSGNANAHYLVGITVYKQAVIEELVDAFMDIFEGNQPSATAKNRKFSKKLNLDPVKKREVYDHMVKAFTKAVQVRPNFVEATFNLALTYHEIGDLIQAEKYYLIVIHIKPDLIRARRHLADLYTVTQRKNLALEQYRRIFYIEPQVIIKQPTLGPEYHYINIYEKFWKELDEDLKINPDDPEKNVLMAKILFAKGRIRQAAETIDKVLMKDPDNQDAKILMKKLQSQ